MTQASKPQSAPRSLRRRFYLALAFNACFFAAVSWWLYTHIRYADLLTQLERIPVSAVTVAMAMNLVVLTLYGLRIATILRARPLPCFLISNIGFTFNALIPFRIGEGVKIYFGSSYFGLPIGSLGAAIVMEKLYDLSAIVLMAVTIGATSHATIMALGRTTILVLALVLVVCALLILRLRRAAVLPRLPEWALLKAPRITAFLRQAERLLANHNVSGALAFTAAIWTINACLVFFLFSRLMPEIDFAILDALSLLVIAALAVAVPASPAGLGIFEAGLVSYLTTVHGVQTEQAISAALAYHFCITAPHTIIAAVFLGVMLFRPRLGPST